MLTFPYRICDPCEEQDIETPADHELDAHYDGSGGGGYVCDDCLSNMAEAAHERSLEAWYGGSGPVTIQEQCAAADRQRRELRGYGHGV